MACLLILQTSGVTHTFARLDFLCAFMSILALICWLRGREIAKIRNAYTVHAFAIVIGKLPWHMENIFI